MIVITRYLIDLARNINKLVSALASAPDEELFVHLLLGSELGVQYEVPTV